MKKVVIGMGFGDEGKGITVARLVAQNDVPWVVRFNGGCQAAHNVITDDGREHTFAQFGSGTFSGAKTFLSRFVLVEPFSLAHEAGGLKKVGVDDPYSLVFIDAEAFMTVPYHWLVNQHKESTNRHGSCGRGIGETAWYAEQFPEHAPRISDLRDPRELYRKLAKMHEYYSAAWDIDLPSAIEVTQKYEGFHNLNIVDDGKSFMKDVVLAGDAVFEGAQGVLLDEWYGFHPHTTWSNTTSDNATTLLHEADEYHYDVVGVIRTYHTRHGHGPFPTELAHDPNFEERHNEHGEWQGSWRVGHFDNVLFRYALDVQPIDELVITHWDRSDKVMLADNYDINGTRFHAIPKPTAPNLVWMEGITEMLKRAMPVFDHLAWADAPPREFYIGKIPVLMVGTGPHIGDCLLQESLTQAPELV